MSKKCVSAVAVSDVSDIDVESLQSSIAKHLVLNTSCQSVCDDSCFSILSRGRSKYHLEVLDGISWRILFVATCCHRHIPRY